MLKPTRFASIATPAACWLAALDALRAAGERDLELLVLFAGTFAGDAAMVTRVIVPQQAQSLAGTEPIGADMVRISDELLARGEVGIWQLHSHPSVAFLSGVDRAFPISHKIGWISAVAPNFARGVRDLEPVRVYERVDIERWRELGAPEKAARMRLLP